MCVLDCACWCLWLCPVLATVFHERRMAACSVIPKNPVHPILPPHPSIPPHCCSALLGLGLARSKCFSIISNVNCALRNRIYSSKAWLETQKVDTILQSWFAANCLLYQIYQYGVTHVLPVVLNVWQEIRTIKVSIFMELKLSSLRSLLNGLYCPFCGNSEEDMRIKA